MKIFLNQIIKTFFCKENFLILQNFSGLIISSRSQKTFFSLTFDMQKDFLEEEGFSNGEKKIMKNFNILKEKFYLIFLLKFSWDFSSVRKLPFQISYKTSIQTNKTSQKQNSTF